MNLTWSFLFKQKTAYEMRISDWSSDVCSSDLHYPGTRGPPPAASVAKNRTLRVRGSTPKCRKHVGTALYLLNRAVQHGRTLLPHCEQRPARPPPDAGPAPRHNESQPPHRCAAPARPHPPPSQPPHPPPPTPR